VKGKKGKGGDVLAITICLDGGFSSSEREATALKVEALKK